MQRAKIGLRESLWWTRRKLLRAGINVSRATTSHQLNKFFKLFKLTDPTEQLIRVGGVSDGGYIVPDILRKIDFLFSPGVGTEFSFDLALGSAGVSCRLLEPDNETLMNAQKKWRRVNTSGDVRFRLGELSTSDGPSKISLESWVAAEAPQMAKGCLQMDIEGDEYLVLLESSPELLRKFLLIVIEFHNLERLLDPYAFPFIYESFNKLFLNFDLVHIRPNHNGPPHHMGEFTVPRQVELTLLRRDSGCLLPVSKKTLPTALDHEAYLYPPGQPRFDLGFPTNWYR